MKKLSVPTRHPSFSLKAPAKINWFLNIVGKRDDGYHNIISLMQCINLYDILTFKHSDTIDVESDFYIPVTDNIVYKAASLLKKYTSYSKGAKIQLNKNIPISAGLGGGSSDAAYALTGLNTLWGLQLSVGELNSIGAEIGSDIPFFLNGTFASVEGRGEKVNSLKIKSSVVLLLVKPPISVSTAWAYASFDKDLGPSSDRGPGKHDGPVKSFSNINVNKLTKKANDIKLFCQALNKQDIALLGTMLNNDLEKVVIEKYPVVGEIKYRLLGMGAITSAMSGSGPTVFGVFNDTDGAKQAAKAMKPDWCRVAETLI